MKKIKLISAAVMGIFVFSLFAPIATATDTGESNNAEVVTTSELATSVSGNATSSIENSLVQLRKKKEEFVKNRLEESKENASALKEKVANKRQEIEAKREELRIKKEEKRKEVLIQLIDIQIKQLEKTRERVKNMSNIESGLKEGLYESINGAVALAEANKIALGGIETPEGLKAFAKELKDSFKSSRDIVKQTIDAALNSRVAKAITIAEGRLAEIMARVAAAVAAGQDSEELDTLLAAVEEKIAAAKIKVENKEFKVAINELKEAYKNMKGIIEKTKTDVAE